MRVKRGSVLGGGVAEVPRVRGRGRAWAGREGQGAPSRAAETSCLGGMSVALACGVALHTESG